MDQMIKELSSALATSGTLDQVVAFSQAVLSESWGTVAKLYHIILGNV